MTIYKADNETLNLLLDKELYLIALIISGLKSVRSEHSRFLFGKKLCANFQDEFRLSPDDWHKRRTSRNLHNSNLNLYQKASLLKAVNFVNDRLPNDTPITVRALTKNETGQLRDALAAEVLSNDEVFAIAFFHCPVRFSTVRDNWMMMGALSQLLCVLATKINCKVFLSHGVEQSKYAPTLHNIEYVLFFNGI